MPPVPPATKGKSWKKIHEESKARKRQHRQDKVLKDLEKAEQEEQEAATSANTTATPTKFPSTVSIAVPGSILENAQSAELRTYVAGQIARAACIFRVNEIVVFDDVGMATARETKRNYEADNNDDADGDEEGKTSQTVRSSSLQLARILQYLECPQYLRKFFFPLHKDLKYSGLLNPLDTPHHLRQQNEFRYREGIIADLLAKKDHSYANVGLLNNVLINKAIAPGIRVTVKLNETSDSARKLRGTVVSPDEPRRELGVYWGYTVRIAHSLSEIFSKSPYNGGYDLTIGTSDRGQSVHEVAPKSCAFNHVLIVFGGLKGLEEALSNDDTLTVDDPSLLFDHYVNVLPKQGSRTIRTEEALLIALAALQEKLQPQVAEVEEDLSSMLPRSEGTGFASGMNKPLNESKKQKKRKHAGQSVEALEPEVPLEHEQITNGDRHKTKKLEKLTVHAENANDDEQAPKPKKLAVLSTAAEDVDDFEVVPVQDAKVKTAPSTGDSDLSRFD